LQKLDAIAEVKIDFVTAANAEGAQHVRGMIDAHVELRVGIGGNIAVDVVEKQKWTVRLRCRPILENVLQGAAANGIHIELQCSGSAPVVGSVPAGRPKWDAAR